MSGIYRKPPPDWVEPFLAALREEPTVAAAARRVGIDPSKAHHRRRDHPDFRAAWESIRAVQSPGELPAEPRRPRGAARLDRFLVALAETSNVAAAAAVADVSVSSIYKLRRDDPEVARRWYAALAEGYDNLEMEVLGRLRAGDNADKSKFDTAAALRCLAAHRESVAREKGRRRLAEEVATIASINAKIDKLRLNTEAGEAAIAAARAENAKRQRKAGAGSHGEA